MSAPTPRSFAGRRDATVLEFMTAYCIDIAASLDEDPAEYVLKAKQIAKAAAKRGATDIGAWMKCFDYAVGEDLKQVSGDDDWLSPIEDILNMTFKVSKSTHMEARLQEMNVRKHLKREDKFKEFDSGAFGAKMLAQDRLGEISFDYQDFPNIKTANPQFNTIKDKEFTYVRDTARICVMAK